MPSHGPRRPGPPASVPEAAPGSAFSEAAPGSAVGGAGSGRTGAMPEAAVDAAIDIAAGRRPGEAVERAFNEHYPPLSVHEATVEADRCYFCHDAPCVTACPTGIDIPLFIRQIASGNREGAGRTIFEANILGGTCARVCPTEVLCQGACVRMEAEEKPVLIGLLQRHATDPWFEGHGVGTTGRLPHPFERGTASGRRVAVVGAGPAGLACAHALARGGVEVTLIDANDRPGGLNEYGIAAYKETNGFAHAEVGFVLDIGGIALRTGTRLGRDVSLKALREEYDAVFLGLGLPGTNSLGMDGESAPNVIDAVEYIAALRQASDPGALPVGRRVVVIGGGMTAVDIACQTRLLGAEDVTIAYRRGEERMNASAYERDHARRLGVSIRTHLAPRVLHRAKGQDEVAAVEFDVVEEREGRLSATGDSRIIECDQLFLAIGQTLAPMFEDGPLAGIGLATERGRVEVDAEGRTSDPAIWAGGDCAATGDDLTVVAVEDGKRAARSILRSFAGAS